MLVMEQPECTLPTPPQMEHRDGPFPSKGLARRAKGDTVIAIRSEVCLCAGAPRGSTPKRRFYLLKDRAFRSGSVFSRAGNEQKMKRLRLKKGSPRGSLQG